MSARAVAALALLAAAPAPAAAHGWYDPRCCDERDCRPVEAGTVIPWATPDGRLGWIVDDPRLRDGPVFVDEDSAFGGRDGFRVLRETPPGAADPFHACVMYGQLRCLYVREPRF